jgi:hypothetical protein
MMMMTNRAIWVGTLAVLGVALPIVPVNPPPAAATDPPAVNLNLEIGHSAPVEVFVIGAQPTQKLRLTPTIGSAQTLTLRWNWQTAMKVGAKPVLAMPLPTIVATIDAQVNQVDRNGDIHYQVQYRAIDIQPRRDQAAATSPLTALFQRQMQSLVGMQGNYVVTAQGQPKSANLIAPKDFNRSQQGILQQFSQALTNLAAPLPEFAMGVGGKWQQKVPIVLNGATIDQETNYELVGLKDGKATIAFTINQTAKNQTIASPSQRIGNFQLESLTANGKGQMVLQLDKLLPLQSSISIDSSMIAKPQSKPKPPTQASGEKSDPAPIPTIETQNQMQLEMSSQ